MPSWLSSAAAAPANVPPPKWERVGIQLLCLGWLITFFMEWALMTEYVDLSTNSTRHLIAQSFSLVLSLALFMFFIMILWMPDISENHRWAIILFLILNLAYLIMWFFSNIPDVSWLADNVLWNKQSFHATYIAPARLIFGGLICALSFIPLYKHEKSMRPISLGGGGGFNDGSESLIDSRFQ